MLLIKEHNAVLSSHKLIEWEHHLYHIADCFYNKKDMDVNTYINKSIHNYHSFKYWENLIKDKCKMTLFHRTNRFLDEMYCEQDCRNPTNLYWDVYVRNSL